MTVQLSGKILTSGLILFTFLSFTPEYITGQTENPIPEQRLVDWSKAGLIKEISPADKIIQFVDYGGVTDGVTDNYPIWEEIVAVYSDEKNVTIEFKKGEYLFNSGLIIPCSWTIDGIDSDSVSLLFNAGEGNNAIWVRGSRTSNKHPVSNSVMKGSSCIYLENTSFFEPGMYLYLSDSDQLKVTSSWAGRSTGQILHLKAVHPDRICFKQQIRRNYRVEDAIELVELDMCEDVVLKNFTIHRLDETEQQTSNIRFENAVNCRVECIQSYKTNFSHIDARWSSHLEISGSHFTRSHGYGGGGRAYGVTMHFGTGDILVKDNTFERLRHSILLQAGANGNVIGYNYSIDPFWQGTFLPSNSAGDAVLHGNYPYSNLFEGNIVQHIVIDDSHGINGPDNVFFRNRAELYGIFMNNSPPSDSQIFVGNEVTNEGFLLGNYLLFGTGHFEYANYHRGDLKPPGTDSIFPASLYLLEVPDWYEEYSGWPPIGYPNTPESWINQAKNRFANGQLTSCISDMSSTEIRIHPESDFLLYPNPVNAFFKIEPGINISKVWIYNSRGEVQLTFSGEKKYDIQSLKPGVYFLRILKENGGQRSKKLIKH